MANDTMTLDTDEAAWQAIEAQHRRVGPHTTLLYPMGSQWEGPKFTNKPHPQSYGADLPMLSSRPHPTSAAFTAGLNKTTKAERAQFAQRPIMVKLSAKAQAGTDKFSKVLKRATELSLNFATVEAR